MSDGAEAGQPSGALQAPTGAPGPATGHGVGDAVTSDGIRERARQQRLAARGDRILDALATLIARWGYGKTTVDDVAREAGVAKGTVYLHWPTKGAMLQALIEREEQQWSADLLERLAADPRGGTISGLYRHSLDLYAQSPLLRALITQDHDALGEWARSPQIRARSHRRMEALHAMISEMRGAGLMRTDMPVEVQAYLIAALSYGLLTVDEYLPADLVPPFEEVADAFAVVVRRGFEPEVTEGEEAVLARGRAVVAALMTRLGDAAASSDQAASGEQDSKHR